MRALSPRAENTSPLLKCTRILHTNPAELFYIRDARDGLTEPEPAFTRVACSVRIARRGGTQRCVFDKLKYQPRGRVCGRVAQVTGVRWSTLMVRRNFCNEQKNSE